MFKIRDSNPRNQERLNAPFLNRLFAREYSRGKTAHQGIRGNGPLRSENGPLRRGNPPLRVMGCFPGTSSWWKTAPLKRPIKRSMRKARVWGDSTDTKTRKMRLVGFNVIGFRWPAEMPSNQWKFWIEGEWNNHHPQLHEHHCNFQTFTSQLDFWPVFTRPFFLFAPFAGDPSSSPFSAPFCPFFFPRKVLNSVSGLISPQSSGRKFLPEICVKKGQIRLGKISRETQECSCWIILGNFLCSFDKFELWSGGGPWWGGPFHTKSRGTLGFVTFRSFSYMSSISELCCEKCCMDFTSRFRVSDLISQTNFWGSDCQIRILKRA